MPQVKTIELAKREMFTPREELEKRLAPERVEHLIRLRDMYNWVLSNPSERDRKFVEYFRAKYNLSQSQVYADLALTKQLLPALAPASREFHRMRVGEMLLETYNMAKARKDVKAMAIAAKELGRIHRVDLEDEHEMPYELIVVQPFSPSSDPTLIGLKPIKDIEKVRARLLKQVAMDNPDIEDVDYEEADLEENYYFPEHEEGEADIPE